MADEPKADRHTTTRRVVSIGDRLWDKLGEVAGHGNRSRTIRELVRRYLAGEPMPPLPPKRP